MSDAKPRRGRPKIPFDFSPYWAKRTYREHEDYLRDLRRKAGLLKAGQPQGFRADGCSDAAGRPVVIPYSRIALEVDVALDLATDAGKRLSERAAVRAAIQKLAKRFGCELRLLPNDPAVETALRKIRAYRRAHPHEYPERFK